MTSDIGDSSIETSLQRSHSRDFDTICAESSPPGHGGISVIRVSGSQALSTVRKLASFLPVDAESHRLYHGTIKTLDGSEGIDEALAAVFHHGRSYTGEETVEIFCHGSPILVQWLLQELVLAGARIADRGEFSYRAFMNGSIDLVQAEGILELIESQTREAARHGLRHLKGGLSKILEKMSENLLFVLASIEAAIDFSTEDIGELDVDTVRAKIEETLHTAKKLIVSYKAGRLIAQGIRVTICGVPNVGKSSLLNFLIGEDKSIVTKVPGTTRDIVEASCIFDGFKIIFSDTAGIRNTDDVVEQIGVERAKGSLSEADFVFFVFDVSKGISSEDAAILRELNLRNTLLIGNKVDLCSLKELAESQFFQDALLLFNNGPDRDPNLSEILAKRTIFMSTRQPLDKECLNMKMKYLIQMGSYSDESMITQARQFDRLVLCAGLLENGLKSLDQKEAFEFVSIDLKSALIYIQELLGEYFDDQIMDYVFKQFCIGK